MKGILIALWKFHYHLHILYILSEHFTHFHFNVLQLSWAPVEIIFSFSSQTAAAAKSCWPWEVWCSSYYQHCNLVPLAFILTFQFYSEYIMASFHITRVPCNICSLTLNGHNFHQILISSILTDTGLRNRRGASTLELIQVHLVSTVRELIAAANTNARKKHGS